MANPLCGWRLCTCISQLGSMGLCRICSRSQVARAPPLHALRPSRHVGRCGRRILVLAAVRLLRPLRRRLCSSFTYVPCPMTLQLVRLMVIMSCAHCSVPRPRASCAAPADDELLTQPLLGDEALLRPLLPSPLVSESEPISAKATMRRRFAARWALMSAFSHAASRSKFRR